MPKRKGVYVHYQTSIGANGFRLQEKYIDRNFEIVHLYHDGKFDKKDVVIKTDIEEAKNYYN